MVIETARELMQEELSQVAGCGSGIHVPLPPGGPVILRGPEGIAPPGPGTTDPFPPGGGPGISDP